MKLLPDFLKGYKRFYRKYFSWKRSVYTELAKGQSPKAVIIACSDSRVDPAMITRAAPGDIFVVRNVANIVPHYNNVSSVHYGTGSALEFAVNKLNVSHVVIQGHSQCAGVEALYTETQDKELEMVSNWVSNAKEAREKVKKEMSNESMEKQLDACGKEALLISLDHLTSYPFIKKRMDEGKLTLHGWYFDLTTGQMFDYDFDKKEFEALV